MSVPLYDLQQLWRLSTAEFNEWRANNDLPILFSFFLTHLPGFENWARVFNIDSAIFGRVIPTGELFVGEDDLVLVKHQDPDRNTNYHFYSVSKISPQAAIEHRVNVLQGTRYEPYFYWAKKNLKNDRFIVSDPLNKGQTDTFVYNLWSGVGQPSVSRASLFKVFEVLKLGGLTLPKGVIIGGKNLDFADLDYLIIEGDWHGSRRTCAYFSSCRELTLKDARLAFFKFYQCNMRNLTCVASKLQDFTFVENELSESRFVDSRLFRVSFERCDLGIDIDKCDLVELHYMPNRTRYSTIAEIYRRFRIAYQNSGKRHEAAECYFFERRFERKAAFSPYREHRDQFPPMKYAGRIRDVVDHWRKRQFTTRESIRHITNVIVFYFRVWLTPKYCLRALRYKSQYILSLIEAAVWGYGERPLRVVATALVVLFGYALGYYYVLNPPTVPRSYSLLDCLYFSIVTFTTLGYGDITPNTAFMKLLSGSEAFLGAFIMGLVVAAFANKSKY